MSEPTALEVLYQDLHAHPELGFEEHRTAALAAERMRRTPFADEWGAAIIDYGSEDLGVPATAAEAPLVLGARTLLGVAEPPVRGGGDAS